MSRPGTYRGIDQYSIGRGANSCSTALRGQSLPAGSGTDRSDRQTDTHATCCTKYRRKPLKSFPAISERRDRVTDRQSDTCPTCRTEVPNKSSQEASQQPPKRRRRHKTGKRLTARNPGVGAPAPTAGESRPAEVRPRPLPGGPPAAAGTRPT